MADWGAAQADFPHLWSFEKHLVMSSVSVLDLWCPRPCLGSLAVRWAGSEFCVVSWECDFRNSVLHLLVGSGALGPLLKVGGLAPLY